MARSTNRRTASVQDGDGFRAFLLDMGRVPLLSQEQEIEYGRQVQRLIELEGIRQRLADESSCDPERDTWAIAAELEPRELERMLHQGRRAKQRMIEANLRLVVSIAKGYQNRGLEFLDLIQEGTLGLNRAVEKFDPTRGYKFSTYATWWIRQAIVRGLMGQSRLVRIPMYIYEKLGRYRKVYSQLQQRLGRSPTLEEWSDTVECPVETLRQIMQQFANPTSLDRLVGHQDDSALGDFIAGDDKPERHLELVEQRDRVAFLLEGLDTRQKFVVAERFGLNDGREKTLAEIAKTLNLSRERVRQVQGVAIKQIKSRVAESHQHL